jgi:DNA-binding CsgD family transcriptional regulator
MDVFEEDRGVPIAVEFDQFVAPETPDTMYDRAELVRHVNKALMALRPRERIVLRRRFGFESDNWQPITLRSIAAEMGLSPERVRQIEKNAIRKLRRPSISACLRQFVPGWRPPKIDAELSSALPPRRSQQEARGGPKFIPRIGRCVDLTEFVSPGSTEVSRGPRKESRLFGYTPPQDTYYVPTC